MKKWFWFSRVLVLVNLFSHQVKSNCFRAFMHSRAVKLYSPATTISGSYRFRLVTNQELSVWKLSTDTPLIS